MITYVHLLSTLRNKTSLYHGSILCIPHLTPLFPTKKQCTSTYIQWNITQQVK